MLDRRLALLGAVGSLAGCAAIEGKAVAIADSLGITAADAVMFFDIVKGLASIAQIADPAFAPVIAIAIAAMTPAINAIEAGIGTAADVNTVLKNAISLQNQVAAAIKIVPASGSSRAYFMPGHAV